MSIDERILSTIDAMYDASLDQTLWVGALRSLTEITGSVGASFWVLDGSDQPRLPVFTTFNFEPAFIDAYLNDMVPMDPTVQFLVSHPDQAIVHDGLVIDDREKDRHPYYDWQRRHSDIHYRMVGQARPAAGVQAGVALHRTRKAGRFEPRDIQQFAILHRHLKRALLIGSRLGTLSAMQQVTTELLDRNNAAVILLDQNQTIVYLNQAAQTLVSSRDGIRISARGIAAERKPDNERLQALIAQALAKMAAATSSPGGAMQAHRPSRKRPYAILVNRISNNYPALSLFRPAVCITIADPDARRPLASHRLRFAFGLTDAEARLAALLAAGENLRSAAAQLQITYGTARARLASIFQKTDTRRQGELIKLLLTAMDL